MVPRAMPRGRHQPRLTWAFLRPAYIAPEPSASTPACCHPKCVSHERSNNTPQDISKVLTVLRNHRHPPTCTGGYGFFLDMKHLRHHHPLGGQLGGSSLDSREQKIYRRHVLTDVQSDAYMRLHRANKFPCCLLCEMRLFSSGQLGALLQ